MRENVEPYNACSFYILLQIKCKKSVGLERGPLSLVSTTEELLDRKVAAPVYKIENMAVGFRHADHVAPSILKSWQSLRRQAAVGVVRSRTQTIKFFLDKKHLSGAEEVSRIMLQSAISAAATEQYITWTALKSRVTSRFLLFR
jgi:hypothetical protein